MSRKPGEKVSVLNWVIENAAQIAGYLILITCVGVALDVACRNLFNFSTQGTVEFSGYFFVGIVFFGLPFTTQQEGGHVRITVIFDRFPTKLKKLLDVFNTLVFIGYTIFLGVLSAQSALTSYRFHTTSRTALDVQVWPYQLFIPLGLMLTTLFLCLSAFRKIGLLFGKPPAERSTE